MYLYVLIVMTQANSNPIMRSVMAPSVLLIHFAVRCPFLKRS